MAPCSEMSSLPAEISFQLTSQGGKAFTLTVPSSALSLGPFREDPQMCQTLINATPENWIVGASLLKHYYSVWDIGGKRMGFAPNGEWFPDSKARVTDSWTAQEFDKA